MTLVPGRRVRYVFGEYVLSPSRRVLLRDGREVPLIPRYFDLLLLLVARREEAIPRRAILDAVWTDVVVSDGALTQAVRTLRRVLGDDPQRAEYVRTVARHGYRFVFPDVRETDDTDPLPEPAATESADGSDEAIARYDDALACLTARQCDDDERQAAAEAVHRLGLADGLRRLGRRPGHTRARAWLRDVRWGIPEAAFVPIVGEPGALGTLAVLFRLRLFRVRREAGRRWVAALAGAASAGAFAGACGAALLYAGPGSEATASIFALLPLCGAVIAAAGAAGVAAGLCCAEVWVRSHRGLALIALGAAGGAAAGALAHLLGTLVIGGLFGADLSPVAGGLEGAVLGAATGLGYALATPRPQGGMATPHGKARGTVGLVAGLTCAVAAILLTRSGSYLGAMSLDFLAHRFPGSQVSLEPLARLLGETGGAGPRTLTAIATWEGLLFGAGTVLGLTHRPK